MSENPIEAGEKKVEGLLKSEPWYVWAGAAVAAGTIVYFVYKRRQTAASASKSNTQSAASQSATDTVNGYTVDSMAGLPYGSESGGYNYQAGPVDNYPGGYSETSVNGSNVPIVPSGVNPIYDSNGNLVGFQSPSTQPVTSPSAAPKPTETGTIRKRQTSGVTASYDKGSPSGVPFRTTPGGATMQYLPYGAPVSITGTPVQGPDNFGKDATHAGSTLWFPVQSGNSKGYVSAYDVVNVVTSGQGGGGIPDDEGGFHLAVNAGRNTVDKWAFANGMHHSFDAYTPIGE